jgi:PHD finger-like domain-containing protein 5A
MTMCRRFAGVSPGMLCAEHQGRCVVCKSYNEMVSIVRVCDECAFAKEEEARCIVCGRPKATEVAYYCKYCVLLEKDRDGCPKITSMTNQMRMKSHHT